MRAPLSVLIVLISSSMAFAQAPAAAPPSSRSMVSAADVAAMIAKAKGDRKDEPLISQRMLELAPYNVSLEYRASVGQAAVHNTEAELFYVVDGAGTLVTGGTLVNENKANAENSTGTAISGGQSRAVAKGDFVMVPEGVNHWFSKIDSTLVLMSLHLPHPPSTAKR